MKRAVTFPQAVAKRRHAAVRQARRLQRGISLIVSLVMLVALVLLGISSAQIALQGEKASRNERDRQIAFQAAEAALMDAELDIEDSPDTLNSRSSMFSKESALGFPGEGEPACKTGASSKELGLCRRTLASATPAWQTVDFLDDSASAASVPFGHFTGQALATGKGSLPSRLSRYVIELLVYNVHGESADKPSYFYRITAIGFGTRDTTQVVLQSFYRKEK
ncbi:N/A [soil metagenome]